MKSSIKNKIKRAVALLLVFSTLNTIFPLNVLALTGGPNQIEFTSFEPVDATDMVNLLTGSFTYTLPILDIPSPEGGYPIALSYHGGIKNEQESSWLGLGWNINPGALNRFVRGIPDDWKNKESNVVTFNEGGTGNDFGLSLNSGIPGTPFGVSASVDWGTNKSLGGSVGLGYTFPGGIMIGGSVGTHGVGFGAGYSKNQGAIMLGGNVDYTGNVSMGIAGGGTKGIGQLATASLGVGFGSTGTVVSASIANNSIGLTSHAGSSDVSVSSFSIAVPFMIPYTPVTGAFSWAGYHCLPRLNSLIHC